MGEYINGQRVDNFVHIINNPVPVSLGMRNQLEDEACKYLVKEPCYI